MYIYNNTTKTTTKEHTTFFFEMYRKNKENKGDEETFILF